MIVKSLQGPKAPWPLFSSGLDEGRRTSTSSMLKCTGTRSDLSEGEVAKRNTIPGTNTWYTRMVVATVALVLVYSTATVYTYIPYNQFTYYTYITVPI